jgi:hypothetical protein
VPRRRANARLPDRAGAWARAVEHAPASDGDERIVAVGGVTSDASATTIARGAECEARSAGVMGNTRDSWQC